MSSPLDLPFVRANTWDVEQLRDEHQLQRMFENRGEVDGDVSYYSVNYDAQKYGAPLHAPYDPPSYGTCLNGPMKCSVNGNFCVTNVVSRPVDSCDAKKHAKPPVCYPGLVPAVIGCGLDQSGQARVQWQCLPGWKTYERRVEPENMNS